ncbi:lymphocyte antigen 96 isoform X2 [Ambystoma mexicanum]|uniref:lymphocyte antigen 96 isoform X2 n=1 Tax=Ambystoma mexicanum TaxID=8296 RepID=UPI0037E9269C
MALMGRCLFFSLYMFALSAVPQKHFLCRTATIDMWYVFCGNTRYAPRITMKSCDANTKFGLNGIISWIPSFDVNNMYWTVAIWYNTLKVSDHTYVLCTGTDDEFEFCGSLKGDHKAIENQMFTGPDKGFITRNA